MITTQNITSICIKKQCINEFYKSTLTFANTKHAQIIAFVNQKDVFKPITNAKHLLFLQTKKFLKFKPSTYPLKFPFQKIKQELLGSL